MGSENAVELVELGGKIANLCGQLADVRAKRDELNIQVEALEKELSPLLMRHTELIAKMAGAALPAPPPLVSSSAAPGVSISTNRSPEAERQKLERRIVRFLESADPGIGALDIARALNVRVEKVREVMRDMATRTISQSMPIEPDQPSGEGTQ